MRRRHLPFRTRLNPQRVWELLNRLTNAFSKKLENHCHALALYCVWYNWCRVHKTLGMTPAMAAGLSDEPRSMSWLVGLIPN